MPRGLCHGIPRGCVYREQPNMIIDLHPPMAQCCICGKWDLSKWGVPVSAEAALIVGNDFTGDWAAKPACEECWKRHDAGEFVGHDPWY